MIREHLTHCSTISLKARKRERGHGRDMTWTLLVMRAPAWVKENRPGGAMITAVRSKGKRGRKSIVSQHTARRGCTSLRRAQRRAGDGVTSELGIGLAFLATVERSASWWFLVHYPWARCPGLRHQGPSGDFRLARAHAGTEFCLTLNEPCAACRPKHAPTLRAARRRVGAVARRWLTRRRKQKAPLKVGEQGGVAQRHRVIWLRIRCIAVIKL